MSYFLVSSQFPHHPNVIGLNPRCRLALIGLLSFSSQWQLTEVTAKHLRFFGITPRMKRALVEYGWLEPIEADRFLVCWDEKVVKMGRPGFSGHERVAPSEAEGSTYVVQAGEDGPVKIGRTHGDVQKRIKSLQTGSAEPLSLIVIYEGVAFERVLHDRFADYRIGGEWFDASVLLQLFGEHELAGG